MILGTFFILLLIALAIWQIISKWQVYRRLKLSGFLVQARVADIKSEARLVAQTGGTASTNPRLKYEDFLYAQWQDPLTQNVHKFRIKIPDFYQFHVGETIPIKMNPNNPNEYMIEHTQRIAKKPVLKPSIVDHDYQQGYRSSTERTQDQDYTFNNEEMEYEMPKASYPQQLLEQKREET